MADFDIPDEDKVDGISLSPYNYPDSHARPLSNMCPTIFTDNNGVVQLVIGASGGKLIPTAVSQVHPIVSFYVPWLKKKYYISADMHSMGCIARVF